MTRLTIQVVLGVVFIVFATACGTGTDVIADNVSEISQAAKLMTDRCSAEVAIVPYYDARPETPGTVILKREASGDTYWTSPFNVQLGGKGNGIRWWCHSTTGNMFPSGTWRVADANGLICPEDIVIATGCFPITGGSSAWEGWTPEQSRCDDLFNRIRARLGPDRLLQIECLGYEGGHK